MTANMECPKENIEIGVSSNAASDFVDAYYAVLNNPKSKAGLADFYIRPTTDAPLKPDITLNGKVIADISELEKVFNENVDQCHYDATSFDVQVINTNYNVGAPETGLGPDKDGKKMSMLVMVSGGVRYWQDGLDRPEEEESDGFVETFIIVPNRAAYSPKAPKTTKRWLIQSQNFRIVTHAAPVPVPEAAPAVVSALAPAPA